MQRKFLVLLPAIAFTSLLIAGLGVSVFSLKSVSEEEWRELKDPAKILSGESTKRFTKLLNQHFVLGPAFNHIERTIQWNLTGDFGPGVRRGCDDWLFLNDELEVHPERAKAAEYRASVVQRLNESLSARGIKLLMVVVPDKTRMESAHLCGLRRSEKFENRANDWIAALTSRGIQVLNLTPVLAALPGERYYHTDTHWNEVGANAAASAVADRLGKLGWEQVQDTGVELDTQKRPRSGDLIHLAGLDGVPSLLSPAIELAASTKVAPVASASDDLFGDAGVPTVALIGTSYSRNSNFVPFLEHHLGAPVANLAKDGGDFAGAATAYFGGATFRHDPPKVVVWEVPERVIEMPLKDIERSWQAKLAQGAL